MVKTIKVPTGETYIINPKTASTEFFVDGQLEDKFCRLNMNHIYLTKLYRGKKVRIKIELVEVEQK